MKTYKDFFPSLGDQSSWEPTQTDLNWCQNLLKTVSDNGVWGTSMGIYKVSHKNKTLTLVAKPSGYDPGFHQRNIIAFKKLDYQVLSELD